MIIDIGEK